MSKIRTLANDATDIVRRVGKKSSGASNREALVELCQALELLAMAVKDLDKRLDKLD